jgi:hypothetical protein
LSLIPSHRTTYTIKQKQTESRAVKDVQNKIAKQKSHLIGWNSRRCLPQSSNPSNPSGSLTIQSKASKTLYIERPHMTDLGSRQRLRSSTDAKTPLKYRGNLCITASPSACMPHCRIQRQQDPPCVTVFDTFLLSFLVGLGWLVA